MILLLFLTIVIQLQHQKAVISLQLTHNIAKTQASRPEGTNEYVIRKTLSLRLTKVELSYNNMPLSNPHSVE